MEVPEEIQARYMERRKKDLEVCLHSLEKKNFTEIEKVGHQLKGNGVTFGYSDLSQIGSHLERAASLADLSAIEKALKDFSNWVNKHIH